MMQSISSTWQQSLIFAYLKQSTSRCTFFAQLRRSFLCNQKKVHNYPLESFEHEKNDGKTINNCWKWLIYELESVVANFHCCRSFASLYIADTWRAGEGNFSQGFHLKLHNFSYDNVKYFTTQQTTSNSIAAVKFTAIKAKGIITTSSRNHFN